MGIMKKTTLPFLKILLSGMVLVLLNARCGDENDFKKPYNIKFTNISTVDITNINLSMNGAEETVTVAQLLSGQSSDYQTLRLPILSKDDRPKGWGDYTGIYTQQGVEKTIYIYSDDHEFRDEVIIEFGASTYFVIYPTL